MHGKNNTHIGNINKNDIYDYMTTTYLYLKYKCNKYLIAENNFIIQII